MEILICVLCLIAGMVIGVFGFGAIFKYAKADMKPKNGILTIIVIIAIIFAGVYVTFMYAPYKYGIISYFAGLLIGFAPYIKTQQDRADENDSEKND